MDLNKLSNGDKVIAGSGIALFLFSFLPWFGFGGYSTYSGWHYFFTGIIPTLLGVLLVAYVIVANATDVELPDLPVAEGAIALAVGGFAFVLILFRMIIGHKVGAFGVSFHLDRKFGLFLSLLAAVGLVVGSVLKFQEGGGQITPGTGAGDGGASGGNGTPTPF